MHPWETKPAEGEKTSVWKKEISFRRKPKPEADAPRELGEPKLSRRERRAEARLAKSEAKAEAKFAKEQARAAEKQAKDDAKAAKAAERGRPPKEPKEAKEQQPSRRQRRIEAKRAAAERKREEAERKREQSQRKREQADRPRPASARPGIKRKKRLVGLKIGSSQLAAARVVNNGSADLVQIAREPLEAGIVVGGEPRQPDELANALKDFFKKHKLPKTGVRLGIASNRIGVRTLEIAGIDDPKQLANAIRFRAQEALPIPLEEAVLDYHVLSERVDGSGQTVRRVLLVVAYRDLIDRYVVACRKAGIKLASIDLEAFGLLRALTVPRGPDEPPRAATVVVNVGHDRSTFGVSDGLHCEFTRVLDWGGSKLGVAIARALDLAPSEAAPIKHSLSLLEPVTPAGLTQEQGQKARDAAQRELHAFARELVSALQFYQNQPGSLGIGEVVLTGGTAELPGIDTELRRLIGVPVRLGDPLVNVRLGKKVDVPEGMGSLATAIGLGIELA